MQKVKIPRTVDPAKSAQKGLSYEGVVQVSLLKRLAELTEGVKCDAEISLNFELDEQKLVVISGKANVEVDLECQRCNEIFAHNCEVNFTCTPIYSEKSEEDAPEDYDLVDLNEYGELDLIKFAEDEFILELPQIPMHDISVCSIKSDNMVFGELPKEVAEDKPNPFDVLKNLKLNDK